MNFLNNLLPPPTKKEELPIISEEDEVEGEKEEEKKEEATVAKKKSKFQRVITCHIQKLFVISYIHLLSQFIHLLFLFFTDPKKSKFADVVNLHVKADLRCLKVFIRGQKARISEISIEGMEML